MTTRLTLTKHHGLGNDFLVALDPTVLEGVDLAALARRVCDRRRGVGADGLLTAHHADGFDARMQLNNADGSLAEMSGNGIRCFAQAIAMSRGSLETLHLLTGGGPRSVVLHATGDAARIEAEVDMGPVAPLAEPSGWAALGCDPMRPVAHLSLGNPHSVVGVDEVGVVPLQQLGEMVPHVNLEIVEAGPEPHGVTMRVHERGAGITEACGTGASAVAWAATQWGLVSPLGGEVLVHMDGGDAVVRLNHPAPGSVTLIGPAEYVGTVVIDL
ncbi:MAG: diaminopimelate epimerase [Ilumatobacteraceae bacterium]